MSFGEVKYTNILIFQLVTHERDILKKDCKRISLERDGAYKHLSLTTAVAAHAAAQVAHGSKPPSQQPPKSPGTLDPAQHHDSHGSHANSHQGAHQLMPHHHHRTASDTGTGAPSPNSMASSAIGKTGKNDFDSLQYVNFLLGILLFYG